MGRRGSCGTEACPRLVASWCERGSTALCFTNGQDGGPDRRSQTDVIVRRLRADDAELLRDIRLSALADSPDAFGETLHDARSADWHARTINGSVLADRAVFVALAAVLPAGMAFVRCGSPGEPAFLGGMWVRPEFRRRHIGTSLVHHALDFLRAAGQAEISLWVTRGHGSVIRFYESLGFRSTGSTSTLRPGSDLVIDELRLALT